MRLVWIMLVWGCAVAATGCMTPEQHAADMAEARRLRGPTAYDGQPAFGEPYGEWGQEKLSGKWSDEVTTPRSRESGAPTTSAGGLPFAD